MILKLESIQKTEIQNALRALGGDTAKAAEALGISVRSIQLKIHQYNLIEFQKPKGRPRKQTDFLDALENR